MKKATIRPIRIALVTILLVHTACAVKLVITTQGGEIYQKRLMELFPTIQDRFMLLGGAAIRAIPFMHSEFKTTFGSMVVSYKKSLDENLAKNPYAVPIAMGTWGGSGLAAGFASQMYFLHRAFPDIVGAEYTLRGLDYVLGVHPVSDISYVSGIGAQSKLIAYGNNRADYTFIPGGMIPGVTVVQPRLSRIDERLAVPLVRERICCRYGNGFHSGRELCQCHKQRGGPQTLTNHYGATANVSM